MTAPPVAGSRGALARYVVAATLVRAADGGGVVASCCSSPPAADWLARRSAGGMPDVAGALVGAAVAPTAPGAGSAYVLTGSFNAVFFAATLAGRSEYAPAAARGQVFGVDALKIAAGSVGTAAAGVAVAHATHSPALLAAVVTAAGVGVATLDRRRHRPHDV